MSDAQKKPLVDSLNRFTSDAIQTAGDLLGKSWPVSIESIDETGTIVTVRFEVDGAGQQFPMVTCPVLTSSYERRPLKKGDFGIVISSDLYLGGVSGLGGGIATMTPQSNLATLAFLPIGNKNFSATPNPNAYCLNGPEGVQMQDDEGLTKMSVGPEGAVITGSGGKVLTANLTQAENDIEARDRGVPFEGLYRTSTGGVRIRILP